MCHLLSMATVIYVGDPNNPGKDRPFCLMFRTRFPLNEGVEVTDEKVLAKLRGNHHFTVDGERANTERASPDDELMVMTAADFADLLTPSAEDVLAERAAQAEADEPEEERSTRRRRRRDQVNEED